MNDLQAVELIEDVFRVHWPNWNFPLEEAAVWVKELRRYDYDRAKTAINTFYMAQTKQGKPPPASLKAALRNSIERKDQKEGELTGPLFGIKRADGRLRWHKFTGNLNMAQQDIEAMALKFCRYANLLETGHYIEYYSTDTEDKGYYGEEGCTITQRCRQARDKAFADILNGPDTKIKRWLQRYLTKKYKAEDGAQQIGELLKI